MLSPIAGLKLILCEVASYAEIATSPATRAVNREAVSGLIMHGPARSAGVSAPRAARNESNPASTPNGGNVPR
eukprot:9213989-Lingulodinium_polyedra.AAC.1